MVFFEISLGIHIIILILILKRKQKFLAKLKEISLFDKYFVLIFYALSVVALFVSFFFYYPIPYNPFDFFPPIVRIAFSSLFSLMYIGFSFFKWKTPSRRTQRIITNRFKEKDLRKLIEKNNLEGSGTEESPFLIENSEIFPNKGIISIRNSQIYMIFKNTAFESIRFRKCSNLKFENCQINYLNLRNCSDIIITKSIFTNSIDFYKSAKIIIEDSEIALLRLTTSFLNKFINCSINKIIKTHSPDNTLDLKKSFVDEARKSNVFPNNTPTTIILIIFSIVFGNFLYYSVLLGYLEFYLLIISIMVIFICYLIIVMLIAETITLQKKITKYYKEKIKLHTDQYKLILGSIIIVIGLILINLIFSIDLINPLLWPNSEYRSNFLISALFICSFIIFLGIFIIMRNISSLKEKLFESRNPLYPIFLLSNMYLLTFLILLNAGLYLRILNEMYLIISPILIILLSTIIIISVLTKRRLRKKDITDDKKPHFSQNTIKIIFAFTLFLVGMLMLLLSGEILPDYIYHLGLIYYPLEVFYQIIIITLTISFVFIGIFSFPKSSKILSGLVYQSREKYEKAIKSYESGLKHEPRNDLGWNNLGATYFKNEEYQKSINAYEKAIEINPNIKEAYIGLGYAYAELGEFDSAINSCNAVFNIVEKPTVATKFSDIIRQTIAQPFKEEYYWHCLGYIYSKKGDFNKAIEAGKKAVDLNDQMKETYTIIAYSYLELGEFEKAIDICNQALKIDDTFEAAWHLIGVIYHRKGVLDQAIQMFMKALELNPKFHKSWYSLAKVYLDLKRYNDAFKACKMVLNLKPNDEEALELQNKIYNLHVKKK